MTGGRPIDTILHIYIPLTLYPRRGYIGILDILDSIDIPPRHPRFTNISAVEPTTAGVNEFWSGDRVNVV
jgi:hypothetical protein